MKKHDARSLPREVQQHNRDLALRLFRDGRTRRDIAEIIGVNYVTVCDWISAWKKGGSKALQLQKRGRGSEEQRKLTPAQEKVLKHLLTDKNPQQLKIPFALWNRKAIQALIYNQWRVRIAVRTIGDYMKRWGFTPQKPLKRAYERNPKAVEEWLAETYPVIQARSKAECAEIYWGDETGIRNDCQHSRGYSPRGQTPVVTINAKRFTINMISAINNRGTVRFMMYEQTMTARVLIKFFKRLIKDAGRKVYLILDNLRVHHAKIVKAWLERNTREIEVHYLPSYSPDLNPDEYLNNDLKNGIRSSSPSRNSKDLKCKVQSHMRMLQQCPLRVANYFRHPSIRYAA